MQARAVRAHAPATIANVGPGFDLIGVAIEKPGDAVDARRRREPGLAFAVQTKLDRVPADAASNVAGHVAALMLEELKPPFGVELTLHKLMPLGSGLGSSAASSVAAAVAVNALLTKPLSKPDLLRFVVEGERLAAGFPHADNAGASLLGGAILVRSLDPPEVLRLPVDNVFTWVVALPEATVNTREARTRLPRTVPLETAVRQGGNVAALVTALARGDGALLAASFDDRIAEPVRFAAIPGYIQVKRAALDAGALACSISGSGPAVFAVTTGPAQAKRVGRAMKAMFLSAARLESTVYASRLNMTGAGVKRP